MKSEIPVDTGVSRRLATLLAPTPKGAAIGRRIARQQLTAWRIDSLAEEPFHSALLIIGELAANASTHGRVPGRRFELALALTVDPHVLRIEVSDCRGDRHPVLPAVCAPNSPSGRGLTLIDALADRWGSDARHPGAKTVWAELDLPAPRAV